MTGVTPLPSAAGLRAEGGVTSVSSKKKLKADNPDGRAPLTHDPGRGRLSASGGGDGDLDAGSALPGRVVGTN